MCRGLSKKATRGPGLEEDDTTRCSNSQLFCRTKGDFWLPYVMSEHVKIERVKVQEKQRAEVMLQKGNAAEKSGKAKGKKG
jgi:hypothetical protein